MANESTLGTCIYCQEAPARLTARKRCLCEPCFVKFAHGKVWRRMGRHLKNNPKATRQTLLLPISFGVSSLCLFHMINSQLDRQRSTGLGRTLYDIHVLSVEGAVTDASTPSTNAKLRVLRSSYPNNTYSQIPLESIFLYDDDITSLMSRFSIDSSINDSSKTDGERLHALRSSLSTPTSRADFDEILMRKLIAGFAKAEGCGGILYGDSDSRLAAKTLANVAMGRGASLPWDVCDGISPSGLDLNFPLRDLYQSELELYSSIEFPDLWAEVGVAAGKIENLSNRNMSIADLMSQYVEQQGSKYPGVMANIVRTVDKLDRSQSTSLESCIWCGMPTDNDEEGPSSLKSLPEGATDSNRTGVDSPTCYGCARTFLDVKTPNLASG